MKHFIYNTLLFTCIFITTIYISDYIITKGLKKSKLYQLYTWNDIFNSKINSDIVFCGPSRTYVQLSPKIFDSILNLNTYNLGMDGWGLRMQISRFYIYIKHNIKPKYIIQNVDFSFDDRSDLYEYEQFLPYLNDTMILNATKMYIGAFTLPDRYFPLFRYNNKYMFIVDGLLNFLNINSVFKYNIYKGYSPSNSKWDNSFNTYKLNHPNGINGIIDSTVLIEFESYLKYCNKNNIKVILEFAPMYYEVLNMVNNKNVYIKMFENLAQKYNIPYLDYTNDSICNERKYFYNSNHLNTLGAELFSTKLANDVKSIIEKQDSQSN